MKQDLLTKEEVMEYLRISLTTLDRLMKSHEIPFHKMKEGRRGHVLFRQADIDAWLESKRVK
jgi:excisionase family DNA binding protein